MPRQITITKDDLIELLAGSSVQPVSLVTRTDLRMRKKGNPYAASGVDCVQEMSGMIGAEYQRAVTRQRYREARDIDVVNGKVPEFKADKLWKGAGEHVKGNRHLVRHKETRQLYLVFFPRTNRHGEIIRPRRRYHDRSSMAQIPKERLQPWLFPPAKPMNQGTSKPIHWRTIKLESILAITMRGVTYHLERTG